MSANNSSKKSKKKVAGPFGQLDPYGFRILLARNAKDYAECIKAIGDSLGITATPEVQDDTFMSGDTERIMKFLQFEGKVPLYTMFLQNRESGVRRVLDVFELVAHLKKSCIVYVSYSAIPLFKLSVLNNFPTILLHDLDEIQSYFSQNTLGNDEQELLYSLRQKQIYVTQEVKTRKEFAQSKKEHSAARTLIAPLSGPSPVTLGDDIGEIPTRTHVKKEKPQKKVPKVTAIAVNKEAKSAFAPIRSKGPIDNNSTAMAKAPMQGKKSNAYKAALNKSDDGSRSETATSSNNNSKNSQWSLPVDVAFNRAMGEGPRFIDRKSLEEIISAHPTLDAQRRGH